MELVEILEQVESRLRIRAGLSGGRLPAQVARALGRLLSAPPLKPDRVASLQGVAREVEQCKACGLHRQRGRVVAGEGNPEAELVFVGEGPGEEEDLQGRPFVGPAGQLLDRIIAAMGLTRQEVFIANVVKCRPPANRVPKPEEVGACAPFLFRQLRVISPRVICALGAVAAQTLLGSAEPIGKMRGRFHQWEGVSVMPTFHPSYLLRNPERKREVWEDMKQILGLLGRELPSIR
jgi:uracil-DNA glycosylase family 4